MGGSVKVQSTVGVGTKFKVTIRSSMLVDKQIYFKVTNEEIGSPKESLKRIMTLQTFDNQLVEPASPLALSPKKNKSTNNFAYKFLIVNDEPFQLMMIEQVVRSTLDGHPVEIHLGSNGHEAMVKVQECLSKKKPEHFDAIILDLEMPIMNGFKACVSINDLYKKFIDHQKGAKVPLLRKISKDNNSLKKSMGSVSEASLSGSKSKSKKSRKSLSMVPLLPENKRSKNSLQSPNVPHNQSIEQIDPEVKLQESADSADVGELRDEMHDP